MSEFLKSDPLIEYTCEGGVCFNCKNFKRMDFQPWGNCTILKVDSIDKLSNVVYEYCSCNKFSKKLLKT